VLYVVGHPDDELLFVNPDLEREIQSGKKVRTVYLTSGDLSDVYTDREQRVMSAAAAMAGVADSWSCASASYGGKPTRRCTLTARPLVSSLFIRVLDGRAGDLYDGATVGTADGATTYTKAQMMTTMSAIITEFQPTIVGTLDGTFGYGGDHPDHIAAALFAMDAARADGVPRVLKMHRGYTIFNDTPPPDAEARNLTSAEHAEKARIMGVYEGGPLVVNDIYDQWCWRFYQVASVAKDPGPFRHSNGKCLEAASATDGAVVRLATCSGAATQVWTFGADSHVRGPGDRCLGSAPSGSGMVIKPCDGAAVDQRWTLLNNGQLKGNAMACLAGTTSTVSSAACATDESVSLYRPLPEQVWQP